MIKSLAPLAVFALLGASVLALPLFAPGAATETLAGEKADRLAFVIPDCSDQVWPNFAASCLRAFGSADGVHRARLVTAAR
jgi:hypothetical protein